MFHFPQLDLLLPGLQPLQTPLSLLQHVGEVEGRGKFGVVPAVEEFFLAVAEEHLEDGPIKSAFLFELHERTALFRS